MLYKYTFLFKLPIAIFRIIVYNNNIKTRLIKEFFISYGKSD